MRILRAFIVPIITIIVILLLDSPLRSVPPLGKLLDPINGWAAAAEPADPDFDEAFSLQGLRAPVTIHIEKRMVPHIRAANDHDLYFVQGYIHAFFRLWQMDFQTRAAAGRIGEVIGEKLVKDTVTGEMKNAVLEFDRGQRRKGMVHGAEQALKAMDADKRTSEMVSSYTAGVNAYINQLCYRSLPIEYKLMDFKPEPWDKLKTALLLKAMADDLTGATDDIPLTILRDQLSPEVFAHLFPERLEGSVPVIPAGTKFDAGSLAIPQAPGDSVWARFGSAATVFDAQAQQPSDGIGSNNWAVSGAHTASGAPILANDPHLGLNLPSLWFEMQLQAPGVNVYGVSLPGAPGIVIGFNDSLSWGLTNNYRDVKDFYEIEAIDGDFYRFDGRPQQFIKKAEVIKIKGQQDFIDTVSYTVHGPVYYDRTFSDPSRSGKMLACTWMAHRASNEMLAILLLNRAGNYIEFTESIMHFECPAQNIIYADRAGNIAIWGQGQFINKWKGQGRYVMKGNTSATLWGDEIPMTENPHALNPEQGYLASANQITTDSTYPYWYNGKFFDFRAWRIDEILARQQVSNVSRMMFMQQDVVSVLAKQCAPLLDSVEAGEQDPLFAGWDYALNADSRAATGFQIFSDLLYRRIWYTQKRFAVMPPTPERTMQLLLRGDSLIPGEVVRDCYQMMKDSLNRLAENGKEWYQLKNTRLTHLAKLDAFSYQNLRLGGWSNTVNAVKDKHGPSWRMIVEMGKDSINAYGVYPGGQSGNPGSRYYGTFVNAWTEGHYYKLLFLPNTDQTPRGSVSYTWTIKPDKG